MKYQERRILSTFADDRLAIDSTFKTQLRSKLAQQQKAGGAKQSAGWRRFLAIPAVAMVVVALLLLTLFDGPASKLPIQPTKVSAMELISRAEQYYENFDSRGYAFHSYEAERTPGPAVKQCAVPGMPSSAGRFYKEINKNYTYAPQNSTVEAYYSYFSSAYNTQEESYYSQSSTSIKDDRDSNITMPLQASTYRIDGVRKSIYMLVDAQGNKLPTDDVTKSQRDGQDVYAFYFRYDPVVGGGQCKDEIYSAVFDAKTYAVLMYDTYIGSVSPENLVVANHAKISYRNIGEAEALRVMTAAGFDMDEAVKNGKAKRDNANGH